MDCRKQQRAHKLYIGIRSGDPRSKIEGSGSKIEGVRIQEGDLKWMILEHIRRVWTNMEHIQLMSRGIEGRKADTMSCTKQQRAHSPATRSKPRIQGSRIRDRRGQDSGFRGPKWPVSATPGPRTSGNGGYGMAADRCSPSKGA